MSPLCRWLRSPLFISLAISGAIFLGLLLLRVTGNFEAMELAVYDWFLRCQPSHQLADSRIVLIGVTEEDIQEQQFYWPLTDATLAATVATILAQQPRAIGLDIYRDVSVPPGHHELEAIMAATPQLVAVMKFGNGIRPPRILAHTERVGFNDLLVDPGGVVRRGLLFLDDGESPAYSFALRLALLYLQKDGITPQPDALHPEHLKLGLNTIKPLEADDGPYVNADARGYQFLLDFRDDLASFPRYSLTSLLAGKVPPEALHDRVVLIGTTALGVKDFFYTPHSRGRRVEQEVFGIVLHAQILSQLLRLARGESTPIVTTGKVAAGLWLLAWCLAGGLFGLGVRSPLPFTLGAAGGCGVLLLTALLAFLAGRWLPVVPPVVGWLSAAAVIAAYGSNQEKRQRASLMRLFSQHVSPEVAEEIWQHRDEFLEGGRARCKKLIATTLFSDLKDFTPLTEKMDPDILIDWLNAYLERMAQLVTEYGGVVDSYAGDGLKADFGVPFPRETIDEIARDATNAVSCALAMGEELIRFNLLWQEQGLTPVSGLRIGINTGEMLAGTLGSAQRLKYTTIGNTVNTASRLESFDKEGALFESPPGPCRILVSEATLNYLGDRFKTMRVGEVKLKGLSESVTVFLVLDRQHLGDENCFGEEKS